jgi:enoyl-CoA hydratase/carnithine racemase
MQHALSSASPHLSARITGPVATVFIDKPARRNAFDSAMWQALPGLIRDIESHETVRMLVLRGAGEAAFSAGADISEFGAIRASTDAALAYDADSERAHAALRASFLPSIAMIRGFCMGGGLALALSCDLRFAATDAKFAIPAAKLGLAYPHQSLRQLVSLCGPSVAKDLLFSARRFGSEEALAMGLIDRVCEPGDLADQVNTYAAMVAENAPLTLRCAKAGIDEAAGNGRGADLDALLRACYESADYAEGRAAFAEKRKPVFRGK